MARTKGSVNRKKEVQEVKEKKFNNCIMRLSDRCKNKNGVLPEEEFYNCTNLEIFRNGKMPICKHCFKEYIYEDGEININKLKKLFMICDYPFYEDDFKSALNNKQETLGSYFKSIQLNHRQDTWSDGDTGKLDRTMVIEDGELVEDNFVVTKEIVKFWGKGFTNEEYRFLQEYYHDMIRIYDHSQPTQINNYKNLAKTQLKANECLANGDMGGYDKCMNIISKISGDSNIKPVQESSSDRVQKGNNTVNNNL